MIPADNKAISALFKARAARAAGQLESAHANYLVCLQTGLRVHLEQADILIRLHREREAEQLLSNALRDNPNDEVIRFSYAVLLSSGGKSSEAIAEYSRIISCFPSNADAHFNRAKLLFLSERLDEALQDFLKVAELDTSSPDPLANAGLILLRQGKQSEAVHVLRQALGRRPNSPEVMRTLASALGVNTEARALYEAVVKAQPEHPEVLTDYGFFLLSSGDACRADRNFIAALGISPHDQSALAGRYLAALDRNDEILARHLMDYPNLIGSELLSTDESCDLELLRQAVLLHPNLRWEPAGRSTSQGQQTTSLDLGPSSPFEDFARCMHTFVERQVQRLKKYSQQTSHPWLRSIPNQWKLQAWATVLFQDGRQRPHIHPAGWMSGVFYLDPGRPDAPGEGNIEFGQAPEEFAIRSGHHTHVITPAAGQMICFPSYFFHCTMPYRNKDGAPRISLAFDVLPFR